MKAPSFWQKKTLITTLLKPLAWFYHVVATQQKNKKLAEQKRLPVPVVVVGNINIGGTGKTPVTIALIQALYARGYKVGLISRGYGRKSDAIALSDENACAQNLGDEPFLIHQKTGVPVGVGHSRYEAGVALLQAHPELDLIISDDGLQHYALHRDFEIAVFGQQGIGNGCILPAGPLREPPERLKNVDAIITIQPFEFLHSFDNKTYLINQNLGLPYQLMSPNILKAWCEFSRASAIAGIAHPSNFFHALSAKGIQITAYPFSDHHIYQHNDFIEMVDPIMMTEKDAVKCTDILNDRDVWVVPLETHLPEELIQLLIKHIYSKVGD